MRSEAETVNEYLQSLPAERKEVVSKLRMVVRKNLPKGFEEVIGYGMIGYVVPFKLYPQGYHCNPETPLPFMGIASQKNFVAVYHMGIYADEKLSKWFQAEYSKLGIGKLDMGKSCIRFKKMDQIPYQLIGELSSKITTKDWINKYESAFRKTKK